MACLHGLRGALLTAFLALASFAAWAFTCTQYQYSTSGYGADTNWYTSTVAAADGYVNAKLPKTQVWSDCTESVSWVVSWPSGTTGEGQPKFQGTGAGCTNSVGVRGSAGNPAQFGTLGTRQGTCQPTCPSAGTPAGVWQWEGNLSGASVCDMSLASGDSANPGCLMSATRDIGWMVGPDGVSSCAPGQTGCTWYSKGSMFYDGLTCHVGPNIDGSPSAPFGQAGSGASKVPTPEKATQPGGCDGFWGQVTVNGVTQDMCVKSVPPAGINGGSGSGSGTVTSSMPDGTTQTTSTKASTTCDPSTQQCTTTTATTVSSSTNTTGTTTVVVSSSGMAEFCKANPTSQICGGDGSGSDSTFGGSCSAGFTCNGDAAMCAAAKATWNTHCDLSASDAARDQALAAEKAASSAVGSDSHSIGASNFSSEDAIGAGSSCIGDKTVTIMNRPVTFAFSEVCSPLAFHGTLGQAVSFLLAMVIVFRRTA